MSISELGKIFLEKTKLINLDPIPQSTGIPQPALEYPPNPMQVKIKLTPPENLNFGKNEFRQLLEQRRSLRKYTSTELSLEELSYLLWATQGVQKKTDTHTLRTVPSAGSRHAFETYLLITHVNGLTQGVYRYLALDHQLVEVDLGKEIVTKLVEASRMKFIETAPVTFIWAAVTERMTWRYGNRGYRYLLLDAGHVCQNLYLSAESINCGACAIDAYNDDGINQLLHLNGEDQFVIYMASVGKKN